MGMVPPAPPAPPGQVQSFIVFFDFDRATLTGTAVQTIQQAATKAKSGQVARLTVTGHADRSGSDAYNMALSLRRANAVKNQLVRDGIAASSIAIIGRGESQPLVPTADGVREPQNRRVEIVLG
jgi:outer membrane protein OmpA-like peptidoglycan-associated protein